MRSPVEGVAPRREVPGARDVLHGGTLGATLAFVLVAVALVAGYRGLARRAKLESADRVLDAEFAALDQDARAPEGSRRPRRRRP